MIFIVTNNRPYSDGRLYFVEAPPSFEEWFRESLVPYIRDIEEQSHVPSIIASASKFTWRSEDVTLTPEQLVNHLCLGFDALPTFRG